MMITDLVLLELSGEFDTAQMPRSRERSALPMDAYGNGGSGSGGSGSGGSGSGGTAATPDNGPARRRVTQVYLEVRTNDEGLSGLFGPVDGAHAALLRQEIRQAVLGTDPLASERIWDQVLRSNRHGRSGYSMMALSALDCALWDLKGKAFGVPVYRLLGGPTRDSIPAYASMLGFPLETEELQQTVSAYRDLGYTAQKWFFRYGPGQGPDGLARNVEFVRAARAAIGDDHRLMVDAFNSWDAAYAIEVGRRIADCRPFWLEEPVPVDRLHALRAIRTATGIPVATGEHCYTRWQVKQLLDSEAADVVQSDPDWCGGISELVKIAALCSAYDVPLVPHGHSLHAALHVAAASSPTVVPMVEFLVLHQRHKQAFMKEFLEPERGVLRLPEAPGLGIELDSSKIHSRRELP